MTTYATNTKIHNGGYSISGNTVSVPSASLTGTVLSSTGTTTAWNNPSSHFNNGNGKPVMTIPHGEEKVIIEDKAELEVKGRIKLNGECLNDRLERIETLLNIPTRDVTMEHKYPKLKELWEEYNRELAKYKTWDKLKDSE